MKTINRCRYRIVCTTKYPEPHNYVIMYTWCYNTAFEHIQQYKDYAWIEVKEAGKWTKISKKCASTRQN